MFGWKSVPRLLDGAIIIRPPAPSSSVTVVGGSSSSVTNANMLCVQFVCHNMRDT